ncbi:MAG: thioredoxin domain-containing protein [Leptolyngbyaceae cyanobacterium bins.349]|nr:thioredoxin domain-containing protein [Leptolyngbyaceae cyanobacterium bins.349]
MPNHLAAANSLYLRKHADNPIDWWYWCDAALEQAQRDDKPIFLSVGYSSCHWCTVMEGEAFSDPAIAAYMNAHFLPIKVDREERPDLDSIYMQSLQMMIGQGGWPLNIFLTPGDQVPFYGGTYFPVEPRYGRPGFLQVLEGVRRFYDQEKEKLRSVTEEILSNLHNSVLLPPVETIPRDVLINGLEYNTGIVASQSTGACFPMIPYAEIALRSRRFPPTSRYDAATVSTQRGMDLALGGIFDHVAGGFHRYTVDPTWTVPHFEKMLYDNGQIVEYLANLWSAGVQEPAFERAIARTVEWLQREMTAPEGYFYAAQDADSFTTPEEIEPEEGAFYVWSYTELAALLTADELAHLQAQFTVTPKGNFEGVNVLQRRHPGKLDDSIETILNQLFQMRYGVGGDRTEPYPPARNNREAKDTLWAGRIPPVTDTKMIVAWNSLMISGLARAATVFQHRSWLDLALNAAQFILEQQWVSDRFHRINYNGQPDVIAQSEDYALFIKALLDIHQAYLSLPPRPELGPLGASQAMVDWLAAAVRVQTEFDEFLWSEEIAGYFNTDRNPDLVVRERSYMDNATPAANGVAVSNLVRLALLTEDLSYLDKAERTLKAFGVVLQESPQASPSLFTGLDWFLHPTLVRTSPETIATLSTQYHPTAVYTVQPDLPTGAIGLVCQGLLCKAPSQNLDQLLAQLTQSQTRA